MDSSFTIPATLPQIKNLTKALNDGRASVAQTETNRWRIAGHGVAATAMFDPAAGVLTVTVNAKPFYVTLERIKDGLVEAMGQPSA